MTFPIYGEALHDVRKDKKDGVVKHIGLSSHTPSVIQRILDDADVDMLMFSVNPAYDYGHGEYANGSVDERSAVYRRCEKEGIGISVMKPFSGGQLPDAKQSPCGKALTQYQCKYYDLALAGDAMAVEHYRTLEKNADHCINCGHCDSRCPFSVKQSERMQEIRSCMAASIR